MKVIKEKVTNEKNKPGGKIREKFRTTLMYKWTRAAQKWMKSQTRGPPVLIKSLVYCVGNWKYQWEASRLMCKRLLKIFKEYKCIVSKRYHSV